MKMPKSVWILAVIALVGALFTTGYFAGRVAPRQSSSTSQATVLPSAIKNPTLEASPKADKEKVLPKVETKNDTKGGKPVPPPPILALIIGAAVASFILGAFIPLIRKDLGWKAAQAILAGSVISVIAITLIFGSLYLSDEEPSNKTVFLVVADFIAVSVLVLAFCFVPQVIVALQEVRSTFLKITALLCFAGAAGGLAYHLQNHKGDLIMPELRIVEEELQTPSVSGDDTAKKPVKGGDSAKKTSLSPSEKDVLAKETVKRTAFHIGFIGDILLGLITANALHLALASLVKYDAKAEDRSGQYFTFLALGIVVGFGGTNFLTSQAKNFAPSEVDDIIRKTVVETAHTQAAVKQPVTDLPQATATAKAVADSLTRFEWPNDAELALIKAFAAALKEGKKPLEKFSVDELIAAAGAEIFSDTLVAKGEPNKYLARLIEQSPASAGEKWTAQMLRAFFVTSQGSASAKSKWYAEAQADLSQPPAPDQKSSEQLGAGGILTQFITIAARINESSNVPDLKLAKEQLEKLRGSGINEREKRAVELAQSVVAFLEGSQQKPKLNVEDQIPLFRLVTAMRALPKEYLEKLADSEGSKSVLAPFIEAAPTTPTPTPRPQ